MYEITIIMKERQQERKTERKKEQTSKQKHFV